MTWDILAQSAVPALPESVGLFDVMQKGGLLMWPIYLCSFIACAVFLERLTYFHRNHLAVGEFLSGIKNLLKREQYREALERCDDGNGLPVALIVQTAIAHRHLPPDQLREIVREIGQLQVPRLEANLTIISTIASITPLLGLLGTVYGMVETFIHISTSSSGALPVAEIAAGIWMALVTTGASLALSIPTFVAYNYLVSRANSIIQDIERAGIETIHALLEPPSKDIIQMPVQEQASRVARS
ncbi:MAG: MotA/TolQ/ExbB proton channel family protein [Candidatus Methylacidiphilales bacterium]|nr:MotA/TolQ/ExbB proton channel family protein [Candidatus Methylacidiphilales bacterium]